MSDNLPGKGVFGWLGRQVGHVAKAVKTRPAVTPPAKRSAPQSGTPRQQPNPSPPPPPPTAAAPQPSGGVLYRHDEVHEAEHPSQPGVKLRRTIIDEVIVDRDGEPGGNP